MKIVFGTTNKAKINFMKKRLDPLGLNILSLWDIGAPSLDVTESGADPLANAEIKALAYFNAIKMPVFSCDSGLFIEGLENARQPGARIRDMNQFYTRESVSYNETRRMSDDEMIEQYSLLAAEFGGCVTAWYQNAICLVLDENKIFRYMGADIASERFLLVSNPHPKRREGFPLDSLSVQIASGLYYNDIEGAPEKYPGTDDGYAAFFKRALRLKQK